MVPSRKSSRKTKPVSADRHDGSQPAATGRDGQKKERFHQHILDNLQEGYAYCQIVVDGGKPVDFIYLEVNTAFGKLTGLKDLAGKKASQVGPGLQASNPELIEGFGRVALTGKPERFEVHIEALGAWFSIDVTSPEKHYFVTLFENITERKLAEGTAEFGERRFRALIENSAEAITLLDANGAVVYDSPAAPGMLGYGPQEWIGKNVFELLHPEDADRVLGLFQKLVETPGGRFDSVFRLRHTNGSWLWIEAVATNLLMEPSVQAIVTNYRDISERKQSEERVQRHIQHLASLHEIDLAIASSFDLRTSLNILLEKVTLQLEVDAACVLLLDPYTNTLEYAAQRGFRKNKTIQTTSIPLGQSFAGRAALERKLGHTEGDAPMQESPHFATLWREESFESYFVVPLVAKGFVKGVLEVFHRAPIAATPDWMDFLSTLGGQAAIAIDNAQLFNNLQRANIELSLAYDATIEGWSYALDLRDKETEGHSLRVTEMTLRLAEGLGLSKSEIVHVRRGALLHDIGKMGVPDHILLKPGPLSSAEWELMKQHPVFAYNMLSRIAYLRPAIDIPYCHHEKWDGSGYPRGLKAEEIPLAARFFAIVDVWDALCSDRTYRPGWPKTKALEHIKEQSGKHFDPRVVSGFLAMIEEDTSRSGISAGK